MAEHPLPSSVHPGKSPWIKAAVLASVAFRLALMALRTGAFDDPDNYLPLARSVAAGQGLSLNGRPTAYRPPLYPLLLAPVVSAFGERSPLGIAAMHLVLGAATVALTALTALRWGLDHRRAAIAAWIVALDPVLAWQARSVMTETLGAALVAASLAALTIPSRKGDVLAGLTFGLAGLCRPSLLPAAALTVICLPFVTNSSLRGLARSLLISLTVLLVLSPWAFRNAIHFGEPVWTTTHGGYTLALANNEVYYRDVLMGESGRVWTGHDQWLWWDSVNRSTAGMSEPQADRFLREGVVRLAGERPLTFLRACLDRLARFWSVAPASQVYGRAVHWASALWSIPLGVLLILGLCRVELWRWPEISAPLQLASLTAVHCLYWTDLRMRAPIVPAIALIAATACLTSRQGPDASARDQETTTSS